MCSVTSVISVVIFYYISEKGRSLTPAQTVIGIANEELIRVLGEEGDRSGEK